MCSESLPKEFEKTVEILPLSNYGLSSVEDFRKAEGEIQNLEWLKKVGLSNEEIKLYQQNEAGLLDQRQNIESSALKSKLQHIYNKISNFQNEPGSSKQNSEQPGTSSNADNILERIHKKPFQIYPEGHPMNEIKDLEESLFGHLKVDKIIPITKRRKILRRLERKKEQILSQKHISIGTIHNKKKRPGSLWDMQEMPQRLPRPELENNCVIGPKKPTMYTIRDNKIVRLEPVQREHEENQRNCHCTDHSQECHDHKQECPGHNGEYPNHDREYPGINYEHPDHNDDHLGHNEEYNAVDIVVPINEAEEELLEGTKMCLDDIRKIDRFKDYEPGIPSKVLYLKNIAPSVTQEQLSLLFNQFVLDNGGPVSLRLLTGRMRGQAFVEFQKVFLAIQALDEINGTILSGRPIIAQFGRNQLNTD